MTLKRTIKVTSSVPSIKIGYFYDSLGQISPEKFLELVGGKGSDVVGRYKYTSLPQQKLTLRDMLIHKNLAEFLKIPSDLFVTCLVSKSVSSNCSTHSFSQTFVRYTNSVYEHLPMHVENLGDPSSTYRKPQPLSDAFKGFLDSANTDFGQCQGLELMTKLNSALQKETESLLEDYAASHNEVFKLEQEIDQLEKDLEKKTEKQLTSSNNNDPVDILTKNIEDLHVGGSEVEKSGSSLEQEVADGDGTHCEDTDNLNLPD